MREIRSRLESAPWYRAHPRAASAVCAGLFGGVIVLEAIDGSASDAIALLYVLPIALAAVTFGMQGGLLAAAAGYGFFTVFALTAHSGQVGVDGWLTRAAAMFLLGGLLGRACDQTARATLLAIAREHDRVVLADQNRRYGEGIEISDSILQHVAAAKWMLEQGDTSQAAELLSTAMDRGQRMVGQLLPSRAADTPA